MVSKIKVGMSTTDILYTNGKFVVICKPGLWMTVGEDSVQYRKHKKAPFCFLSVKLLQLNGLPESFGSSFSWCSTICA